MSDDDVFMFRALALAKEAAERGEVPVGAVVVEGDRILGEGRNAQIESMDPTAHAEIKALRAAATSVANYRIPGATLYVSLEPCSMCCGALIHARISTVIFAAREPRAGAVVSTRSLLDETEFNHRVAWVEAVEHAPASAAMLRSFFRERR
ncbi:tRNA adenosine(34) deaminase TadA [Congregibacter sp.]|jgi:tRNA(adenine34) deaminase|uniref:tRNA adenosine(34) deaminase TadA n=1 Tax=Congregibacter sp. TaxID=2744308 RepID=UPI0039E51145